MAFFKLRLPGRLGSNATSADALSNTPAQNVEVIRKRARHRLMGSVILVLGAVVGLPLLFDSQPRPVAIDTPIVIPDRNQVAPLVAPSAVVKPAAPSKEIVVDASDVQQVPGVKSTVANVAALDPHEEMVTKDTKAEVKPDAQVESKTDAKDGAKAKALLDGKDASKSTDAASRSVVQVGAFADLAKAKEARAKLEHAGIKTYTQDVDTKDGKRTRVRVGPFATKEEAEKTAEKIRKLNLQATVLKL